MMPTFSIRNVKEALKIRLFNGIKVQRPEAIKVLEYFLLTT